MVLKNHHFEFIIRKKNHVHIFLLVYTKHFHENISCVTIVCSFINMLYITRTYQPMVSNHVENDVNLFNYTITKEKKNSMPFRFFSSFFFQINIYKKTISNIKNNAFKN